MLVINSIEKTRLSADSYSYSGTGVAWKARLVLFLGFALMAGGLAGSVVSVVGGLGGAENIPDKTLYRLFWFSSTSSRSTPSQHCISVLQMSLQMD